MRKVISIIIMLVMCVGVATSCKNTNEKTDPNLGLWSAYSFELFGSESSIYDLYKKGTTIDLKGNGACILTIEENSENGKWEYVGDKIKITSPEMEFMGSFENETLALEIQQGVFIRYKKGENVIDGVDSSVPVLEVPAVNTDKPITNTDNTIPPSSNNLVNTYDEDLTLGIWQGNSFVNNSIGLVFTIPEGSMWNRLPDENIAGLMDVTIEKVTNGTEYSKELLALQLSYDLVAIDYLTGSNVISMFENLELSHAGETVDEDMFLEFAIADFEGDPDTVISSLYDTFVSGYIYRSVLIEKPAENYSQLFMVRKVTPTHMHLLVITATEEGSFEEVLTYFG